MAPMESGDGSGRPAAKTICVCFCNPSVVGAAVSVVIACAGNGFAAGGDEGGAAFAFRVGGGDEGAAAFAFRVGGGAAGATEGMNEKGMAVASGLSVGLFAGDSLGICGGGGLLAVRIACLLTGVRREEAGAGVDGMLKSVFASETPGLDGAVSCVALPAGVESFCAARAAIAGCLLVAGFRGMCN